MIFAVFRVNSGHADGHRAVDVHRNLWNALGFVQLPQIPHQRLRAPHRKRRNHHRAATLRHPIDRVGQRIRHRTGGMVAIAVGRFAQQKIRARRRGGIVQDRLVITPHVAGKHDHRLLAVFGDGQFKPARAEDVSGVMRSHGKFRTDRERIRARNFLELVQRRLRIGCRIQGQGIGVAAVFFLRRVLRVFFLQVRRIQQQQLTKLAGRRVAVYWPAISGLHNFRQVAGVVDVRVGHHHPVDGGRVERQRVPVPLGQFVGALK